MVVRPYPCAGIRLPLPDITKGCNICGKETGIGVGWNEAGGPIKSILPALIRPTTNMKSDVVLLSPLQETRHEGGALPN